MVRNLFKRLFIITIVSINSFLIGQTAYANWSGETATGAEDSDPSVPLILQLQLMGLAALLRHGSSSIHSDGNGNCK